ncbi:hypothetical protein M3P36_06800 [Altererythrobacter sp. KTW20L]|uniref:hypothetical protein n=1 Tax=Altererythrobacter sp. KTW20L TaxID=2942210 RepID=UPI0020C10AFA|nr:hypothetical protein [Altererythrobacter sp. KTW20L]MCL6250752.1 hypothetical protein [Altererythrobacter sp. KTW20L]
MSLNPPAKSRRTPLLVGGAVVVVAAIAVLFVLPAETGWDPTGVGAATGLVKIASPDNEELERGLARMETEDVLLLSDTPPAAEPGATDVWEYELAPYESIEFKYTAPEDARIAFRWEGSAPLNYDMHSHPFDGGVELTESFGVSQAQQMQGIYIAPFTGIHGWYWQNRSTDNVIVRLEASGGMTTSTIYSSVGEVDRPLEGVENSVEGSAAGHDMQGSAEGDGGETG